MCLDFLKDPRSKLITVYIGSTPIQITWSRLSGLGLFLCLALSSEARAAALHAAGRDFEILSANHIGELSERFKEAVLKTVGGASLPGVRISHSPPSWKGG